MALLSPYVFCGLFPRGIREINPMWNVSSGVSDYRSREAAWMPSVTQVILFIYKSAAASRPHRQIIREDRCQSIMFTYMLTPQSIFSYQSPLLSPKTLSIISERNGWIICWSILPLPFKDTAMLWQDSSVGLTFPLLPFAIVCLRMHQALAINCVLPEFTQSA